MWPLGTRVLAGGPYAFASIETRELLGDRCYGQTHSTAFPPITKAKAIEMILADNAVCASTLAAADPAWTNACAGEGPPVDAGSDADASVDAGMNRDASANESSVLTPMMSGDGCAISLASSSPESVSVLLAVLSALAVRRSVRRR